MNSVVRQGKRIHKKELRAKEEQSIAKQCAVEVARRRSEAEIKVNDMRARVANMEAQIKKLAAANPDDPKVGDLLDKVEDLDMELKFSEKIYGELDRIYELMNTLLRRIDACIQLGWYKFVIKTIPEKKLPLLISSEKDSDLDSIYVLVSLILNKVNDRIDRDKQTEELVRDRKKAIADKEEEQRKRVEEERRAQREARLARINGSAATATAEMPLPIANAKDDDEVKFNRA